MKPKCWWPKKVNGQVIVCKGVPSYSGIVTIHRWSFQSCLPVILLTKRGVFICGHYPQCIGLHHTGNSPPLAQTLASRYEKSLYRDPPSQGLAPASPPPCPLTWDLTLWKSTWPYPPWWHLVAAKTYMSDSGQYASYLNTFLFRENFSFKLSWKFDDISCFENVLIR